MKTRTLATLLTLCKWKRGMEMNFSPDWIPFWTEALSWATRERKTESIASEKLIIGLIQQLIAFLHESRKYLTKEQGLEILSKAMDMMKDVRSKDTVLGVILMVRYIL